MHSEHNTVIPGSLKAVKTAKDKAFKASQAQRHKRLSPFKHHILASLAVSLDVMKHIEGDATKAVLIKWILTKPVSDIEASLDKKAADDTPAATRHVSIDVPQPSPKKGERTSRKEAERVSRKEEERASRKEEERALRKEGERALRKEEERASARAIKKSKETAIIARYEEKRARKAQLKETSKKFPKKSPSSPKRHGSKKKNSSDSASSDSFSSSFRDSSLSPFTSRSSTSSADSSSSSSDSSSPSDSDSSDTSLPRRHSSSSSKNKKKRAGKKRTRDALNGLAEESKYSVRLSFYETQERLIGTALKPRGSSALRDYMKMIQEQAIYQSSTEYRRHAIALTRFFSHTQTQFLKTGDLLGGLKPKKVPEHFRRYAWGYLSHAAALYPP